LRSPPARSPADCSLPWPRQGILGGTLGGDLGKMTQLVCDWSERYGPVLQSQLFNQKMLFVTDPTLASGVRTRADAQPGAGLLPRPPWPARAGPAVSPLLASHLPPLLA
jgi:hypothetical protein